MVSGYSLVMQQNKQHIMLNRKVTTKDIKGIRLISKNILNTTLVTQLEVVENGVVKYYNWGPRNKVYAMLEDTGKTLRLYINNKTKADEQFESDVL
jgi:hypothetical protein